MEGIFTELKRKFRSGSILSQYIYINVGVFVLIRFLWIVMFLFKGIASFDALLQYIEMPSSPMLLLHRPWTVFTYMFVHFDFFHLLFNMLWLYWFGHIFMQFFNPRQLGGLYVLGGIAGGACFVAAYNLFPYFDAVAGSSFLKGASASVMAIVFAVSFYQKDYMINLMIIGRIRLIYLALSVLFIDFIAIASENAGGRIAHIGGALLGIFFASQYQKGKDITNIINHLIDRIVNFATHKPSFKVKYGEKKKPARHETDDEYRHRRHKEEQEIDAILDKLKRSGYESLSEEEKKKLFDASRR